MRWHDKDRIMDKIIDIFVSALSSDKKYWEYQFCENVACGSMKTISGPEAILKNYQDIVISSYKLLFRQHHVVSMMDLLNLLSKYRCTFFYHVA